MVTRNAIPQHACVGTVHRLRIIHVAAVLKRCAGGQHQARQGQNSEGRFHRRQIKTEPPAVSIPERFGVVRAVPGGNVRSLCFLPTTFTISARFS